jgi:hypothetical protein
VLDQREADYDAYNAALLLTLGALGARERLRALFDAAVPVAPADPRDDDTLHAILGLWATLDRVATHAATVPPRAATPPPAPATPPSRLTR